ncbi:MAG: trigger factor [Armatimonadetes bacterium]|nr:trigger factor [Armatimonadota bacterium]NIM22816.1 trigger factor [Armatimonadota bacterium]NIM66683.1 trigger factor [Armatimonadota bacterium]NIM75240.1 trigger factor [Armatimonadota bacterium]NIN04881.1 trigger factor [Armatimonadota bacterium]
MQVEIERQEEGEVGLRISVGPDAVAAEVERVFQAAAKSIQIPGFRPGRAPRAMIESRLNMDEVRKEAQERLTHSGYLEALDETGLEPIDRARVEDESLQEDGGFTFRAVVPIMPEVKLGEYRRLKAKKPSAEVTEEAVEEELERLRGRLSSFVPQPERAIEEGDIAIIDYAVEVDGNIVEKAGVQGYPLEVGNDSLFPQLNEGLLGAKQGEALRIENRLPKNHPDTELADKEAVFVVTVKDVKVRSLPELSDEFARRVADVKDLEELRKRIRESLEKLSAHLAEEALRERLVNQVIEASEFEPPRLLVDRFMEARENELTSELERQGTNLESYLAGRGMTYAAWKKNLETEAERNLKRFLVMREVERKEGITASDEEIEAEIARLAERDQVSPAAKRRALEADNAIEDIAGHLRREKALQVLLDSAEISLEEPEAKAPVQTESPEHGKE